MRKSSIALATALMFAAGSAFAFHCPQDMKKIDDALAKNPKLDARCYTIRNACSHVRKVPDPWRGFAKAARSLRSLTAG